MSKPRNILAEERRQKTIAFNEQLNKPIATIPIVKKKMTAKELVTKIESEVKIRKMINPLQLPLIDKINFQSYEAH